MKLTKFSAAAIPVLLLTACAGTKQMVDIPDQSKPIANRAKSRIYVVRDSMLGGMVGTKVYDSKQYIGMTYPHGCLSWERKPGKTKLISKAENTSTYSFTASKGETYYFKQAISIGIMGPRAKLVKVNPTEGKKLISQCKFSKK